VGVVSVIGSAHEHILLIKHLIHTQYAYVMSVDEMLSQQNVFMGILTFFLMNGISLVSSLFLRGGV